MRKPLIGLLLMSAHLLAACADERHNEFKTCMQSDGSTTGDQHKGYKAGCGP
jgi:hypothetical protein